jgi:hypothetical protein
MRIEQMWAVGGKLRRHLGLSLQDLWLLYMFRVSDCRVCVCVCVCSIQDC